MTTSSDQVAESDPVLSPNQIRQFHDVGHLVIKNVIPKGEAQRLYDHILDMVPRNLDFPEAWHVADGRLKPYHEDGQNGTWDTAQLLPSMCHPTLYRAATQLLGSTRLRSGDGRYVDGTLGITLRNDVGPPRSQRLHVDASIPREAPQPLLIPEEVQVGGCFYFNDVVPNGGGIHVIPEGHRLVAEKVSRHPDGWPAVYQAGFFDDFPDSIEITAEAGDFVAIHHLVPHAASNNRQCRPRVAQFVRFLREDNPHYPGQPAPANRYNEMQLKAMGHIGRRLLGVDPW